MSEPIEPVASNASVSSVEGAVAERGVVPVHSRGRTTALSDAPPRRQHSEGGLHKIVGFLAWVFSGFGLISALRKNGPHFADQEITVYSVHRAFFLWPLVFTGFIGALIVGTWPHKTSVFMGWFYIFVLTYTLVSVLFDISTWKFVLWAGILLFIYILFRYVEVARNVQILSHLSNYMRNLHPELNHGFAVIMSWLLLIPWVGSLFSTFTNGRKKFTPNEIIEWHLGDGRELTDRSGLKFRSRYRNIFMTVLGFGAGDLQAIDGTGVVRKSWENILFLYFVWNRIDEILCQRAAIVDNRPDEPVEVEEVRPQPHQAAGRG
jgi:hypothetical protein